MRGHFSKRKAMRERALKGEIAQTKKNYCWWFDHPLDWGAPAKTLYLVGWCVPRGEKQVRAIRAGIGRRKIAGNCGILRPDVAAAHGSDFARSGFAIAVPLPCRKARLTIEVQNEIGTWQPILNRELVGSPNDDALPPQDAKYFIPNPAANSRLEFWLDLPSVWTKKIRYLRLSGWCLAIAGAEIAQVRARVRGKEFAARFGTVRPDIALLFENRPGALRSGFSLDVFVPPGRSRLILEARSGDGPWEIFFEQTVRGPYFREEFDEGREVVGDYSVWIRRYDRLRTEDRRLIRDHIERFQEPPLISVLLPVYNSHPKWLRRAIRSVEEQLYPHWELCVVDDASTDKKIWPLLEKFARRDNRIRIIRRAENGHISATSNDALALARGEFIALLDHDDELTPTALYFVALALQKEPDLQLLYSDEDKLDRQSRRSDPYFKSDWNPQLFLGQNYISHLGVYRTELVRRIGGFRIGFEGSQDYDLTLRCIEQIESSQIHHIPRVLYHWRTTDESTATVATAKPYAQAAAQRAVQEHLDRTGFAGEVVPYYANYLRVKYALPRKRPLVSILIPTRDRVKLLRQCLESIFEHTTYESYEVIVLDNESRDPETEEYLCSLGDRIRVERIAGAFNYSRLNNRGVELARGAFVLLLNNDVMVMNDSWLGEMMSHATRPEVGMVGARLWYPNGTMQHGGVILGAGGIAGHAHAGIRHEHGYFARAHLTQNFSAVTAACALTKRELYRTLGGLDEENLAVAFNDIDFCLRLREAGYEIVWTPHAELRHDESASRGFDDTSAKQVRFLAEIEYMNAKWGEALQSDPFYNPNLSLGDDLFTLAFPPRRTQPWKR
jgi:glycosyltransferase involved in cell wall biosynthesis